MPSAMVGNSAVQSVTPDMGNGSQSEAMKQVLGVMDKKVRNMEKKKVCVVLSRLNAFVLCSLTLVVFCCSILQLLS